MPEFNQKLIDYQTRKSIHITLTKSTHSDLRTLLFKRGLSMQEVFNRLASLICEQNTHLVRLLDSIELEKKDRQIKQVTRTDAESIFELIETSNPFELLDHEVIEEADERID